MKFKFAEKMYSLQPSGIRKVNEKALALERAGEKVIHFEIGRPDFDTPAYIKDACARSLANGDVFYTSSYGDMGLRKSIASYINRRFGLDYTGENVIVTAGLAEAIFDTLSIMLEPDDEVLVPDPIWANYLNIIKLLSAKCVSYNLLEENDYQPNLDEIKAKITPKTKILIINTPNNPTGSMLDEATMKGLAQIAVDNDLIVMSDEVYERLTYDKQKHICMATLPGMKERTIVLNGFSKTYSMTGWRLGYAVAPEEVIGMLNKFHMHAVTCANSFSQKAAIIALDEDEKHGAVEEMVVEYRRRRDYAVKAINAIPGISCACPTGAFYIFINIKALNMKSADVAAYLLDHQHIALVPGDVFGLTGEGYIRMSFANSYENIVDGCKLLAQGIGELMAKKS